jgi:hypothetical protein
MPRVEISSNPEAITKDQLMLMVSHNGALPHALGNNLVITSARQ